MDLLVGDFALVTVRDQRLTSYTGLLHIRYAHGYQAT